MKKLILKFATGLDAHKEYSFELQPGFSLTVGRDPACQVPVNEQEDAVSRRHALIQLADPAKGDDLILVDNGSANGLFVNEVEVKQRHPINDEDVIRLGRSGPTMVVGFDPKPIKATRVVSATPMAKATRLETPAHPVSPTPTREQPAATAKASAGIGKETLERRIDEVRTQVKSESNNKMISIGAVVLGLLVALGGFGYYKFQKQDETLATVGTAADQALNKAPTFDAGMATQIRNDWANSTVRIEATWQMVHVGTGIPVTHETERFDGELLPMYEQASDGSIVPSVTMVDGVGRFGGTLTGSGFVVSPDGFILTNKHIAQGWTAPFSLPKGIIKKQNGDKDLFKPEDLPETQKSWAPGQGRFFDFGMGKVEGRIVSLNVIFPNSTLRIPARLAASSDKQDVALLKIDAAQPLKPVVLNDAMANAVQAGNKVAQLGFPGPLPTLYLNDETNAGAKSANAQDVSVNEGIISKLVPRTANAPSDSVIVSELGDYIEMNMNTSGPGNSGGPVFDTQGKVIGLFTEDLLNRGANTSITRAVPIHYGLELIDPTRKAVQ